MIKKVPLTGRRKFLGIAAGLALAGAAGYGLYRHFSATVPVHVESFMTEGNGKTKNILLLTGSARENGNSAEMARAFANGAMEKGHTVNIFNCGLSPMNGCLNCDACWSTGQPCVQNDSFEQLVPLLRQAEMLVAVSPLYWYNFSGQLKCAIDRFYPWSRKDRPENLKISEAMLMMCGESFLPRSFAGAAESWRQILGLKGWKDRGRLFALGIGEYGAMAKSDYFEKAFRLGQSA